MGKESKAIRKTDDSAVALVGELLGDTTKSIATIDSYYCINGTYYFLKFIKCVFRPFDYDPNADWVDLKTSFSFLWDFVCRAEGVLWLVLYEAQREQFKLLRVQSMDEHQASFSEIRHYDFDSFKAWFQQLNSAVLNSKS